MADIGVGAGGGASVGGVSSGDVGSPGGVADQASFEQAAQGQGSQTAPAAGNSPPPPDAPTYRQQMEGLRKDRKELEAERDTLRAGVASKHSVPEMQKEVQRVGPDLARLEQDILKNDREQTALAEGMKTNDIHEEGETCKITVEVKPAVAPGIPGNHSYVKMMDNDGEHYGRGGPESRVKTPESNPPWGSVHAETGDYSPRTPDWTTGPRPSVTVAELPGDCSSHADKMGQIKEDINGERHNYRALFGSQSCNTTTSTILERMGLDAPDNLPGWEPGYDKTLPERGPADASENPVMNDAVEAVWEMRTGG